MITLEKSEDYLIEISTLKKEIAQVSDLQRTRSNREQTQNEALQMHQLPVQMKAKQVELEEAHNALKLRENTIDALAKDLEQCLINSEALANDLEAERVANRNLLDKISDLQSQVDDEKKLRKEIVQQKEMSDNQSNKIIELEDCLERNRNQSETFQEQLKMLHEESAKQILRIKDRTEAQRTALQAHITGLEKELAHVRAIFKAACKERDDTKTRFDLSFIIFM